MLPPARTPVAAYEAASGRVKTHFGGEERGGAVGSGTAPCRTAAVSLVKTLRVVWEPPVPEPGPTLPPVEARRAALEPPRPPGERRCGGGRAGCAARRASRAVRELPARSNPFHGSKKWLEIGEHRLSVRTGRVTGSARETKSPRKRPSLRRWKVPGGRRPPPSGRQEGPGARRKVPEREGRGLLWKS